MSMQEVLQSCVNELLSLYSKYGDIQNAIDNSSALKQATKYVQVGDVGPDEDSQVCIIERVDNGFILRMKNCLGKYSTFVFESSGSEDESLLEAMSNTFLNTMEYFGFYNSKHDSYALAVEVVDQEDFPVGARLNELKDLVKSLECTDSEEASEEENYVEKTLEALDESDMEDYLNEREENFDT